MLYDIIVAPIEMVVDWVFLFATNYMSIFGVMGAIVCVSMAINFLTLPIYNVADKIQNEERETQKKLTPGIERIKAAFSGDERFMILQTFYRQNHYSPIYALRSSISVLIQIPFFMAAYHYLSNNELLQEGGFLFVKNLGEPDVLFSAGSFAINVLPIFMTFINVVSGIVYTKGFPLREKVQVYGLAAVFLVLLYNSPSGLVLYWIMNNVFSLCKNFVKKTRHPVKVVALGACILLLAVLAASFALNPTSFGWKKKFLLAFVTVCSAATLFSSKAIALFRAKFEACQKSPLTYTPPQYINSPSASKQKDKTNFLLFISSAIGLALLAGFLLPSSVIATSPTEFSFLGQTESPLSYIYSSVCVFAGFFILWPVVIYKMFSGKVRKAMPPVFFVAFVCALLNAYVFKHNYGNLNATFMLDNPDVLKRGGMFLSLVPFAATVLVLSIYILCRRLGTVRFLYSAVFSVCLAATAFSVYKMKYIGVAFAAYRKTTEAERIVHRNIAADASTDAIEPIYHLSKEGKNVVVLMLDRAIGSFFPYIVRQFPELASEYDGFTHYPNTVSFGQFTNLGFPGLTGGYEYTLDKINDRKDELLKDKHNEAIFIPYKLFSEKGWQVTYTNMPYIDYGVNHAAAIKDFKDLTVQYMGGKYVNIYYSKFPDLLYGGDGLDKVCRNQIKNFSLLEMLFPLMRNLFYSNAVHLKFSDGFIQSFSSEFSSLYFFNNLTAFDADGNTYNFIDNGSTHEQIFLDENYEYPTTIRRENTCPFFTAKTDYELKHYHINIASLKAVAKWLNFLKGNDCYDNTRIIIVADHGRDLNLDEIFPSHRDATVPAFVNPLLLVKDFDAHGEVQTDDTFMTNADTLFLSKEGLELSDINPFTGKKLVQEKENGVTTFRMGYTDGQPEWNVSYLKKKKEFDLSRGGWIVKDNIFDESNWTPIELKNER